MKESKLLLYNEEEKMKLKKKYKPRQKFLPQIKLKS